MLRIDTTGVLYMCNSMIFIVFGIDSIVIFLISSFFRIFDSRVCVLSGAIDKRCCFAICIMYYVCLPGCLPTQNSDSIGRKRRRRLRKDSINFLLNRLTSQLQLASMIHTFTSLPWYAVLRQQLWVCEFFFFFFIAQLSELEQFSRTLRPLRELKRKGQSERNASTQMFECETMKKIIRAGTNNAAGK